MTTNTQRAVRHRGLLLLVILAMVLAACAGASSELNHVGAPIDEEAARQQPAQPAAQEPEGQGPSGAGANDGGEPPNALRDDLKVVYTGSLQLVVDDLQATLAKGRAAVAATGGYIGASHETNEGELAVATITYRIPATRWEDAIAALRGLATKVVSEPTQATEVGGQIVDLEARLRNLRASEQVLVGIAEGTGRVTDLLEVQARISEVRGQIEQLDAQRLQLEDQAAYGTLVATYGTEVEQVEVAAKGWDPKNDLDAATATLVEAGQTLVSGAIWFGIVWLPVILLVVVTLLVIRWAFRRFVPSNRPGDAIAGWGGGEG